MTGSMQKAAGPRLVVATLGLQQILAWGSTFYILGVLGQPIADNTGWPFAGVEAGIAAAFLVAGAIAPHVGRAIGARGGRPVLAASSILLASGLALLGSAPTLPVYMIAWCIIGAGMGAGLYDPAFSTLGHLYGHRARQMITAVTLFGGFASTVFWPVTAFLLDRLGWRGTCLAYAGVHLAIGLPAYLIVLPRVPMARESQTAASATAGTQLPLRRRIRAELLLAAILTISAATLSLISMHILGLLQARGLNLAAAVALGSLVGPSQVAARLIEMAIGRHYHPIWTMLFGAILVAVGMLLLWAGWPVLAIALMAYGAGNGISSIVRGSVPLVLFGPDGYPQLMGRLGRPVLLAMALAPAAGAFLIEHGGSSLTFGAMVGLSLVNVLLVVLLARLCL
jgi:predicted MFS family arabinose efflux permease